VGLILSGIPSRAVAIIGVFADGVNFWFFAELNHRPFGSRLSQEPAINPPLAISANPDAACIGRRRNVGLFHSATLVCRAQMCARRFGLAVRRS
jgi:hypothetical protein